MFITCLAYTKDIPLWQIHEAITSFNDQTYDNRQLIIINNHHSLLQCLQLEIIFNSRIIIIDRPGYSNGKALLEGLQLGTGQIIAHWPLDHYHHQNRLKWSLDAIIETGNPLVSPSRKWTLEHGHPRIIESQSNVWPELAVYRSPAYTDNYEIDYGAWWQYPLLAHEQGMDIVEMEQLPAVLLPNNQIHYDYKSVFDMKDE